MTLENAEKIWHAHSFGTGEEAPRKLSSLHSSYDKKVKQILLGGVGVTGKSRRYLDKETGDIKTPTPSKLKAGLNKIVKRVAKDEDFDSLADKIGGLGEEENIEYFMHQLAEAPKNGQLPERIVLTGHSRGAGQSMELANRIYEKYGSKIKITMHLTDPVMGPLRRWPQSKRTIPPNVDSVTIVYAGKHDSIGFEPQDFTRIVGYDPAVTTITAVSIPMNHFLVDPDPDKLDWSKNYTKESYEPLGYLNTVYKNLWAGLLSEEKPRFSPPTQYKNQSVENMQPDKKNTTRAGCEFVKVTEGSNNLPPYMKSFHENFRKNAFDEIPPVIAVDIAWEIKKKKLPVDTPEQRKTYLKALFQHGLERKAGKTLENNKDYQRWIKQVINQKIDPNQEKEKALLKLTELSKKTEKEQHKTIVTSINNNVAHLPIINGETGIKNTSCQQFYLEMLEIKRDIKSIEETVKQEAIIKPIVNIMNYLLNKVGLKSEMNVSTQNTNKTTEIEEPREIKETKKSVYREMIEEQLQKDLNTLLKKKENTTEKKEESKKIYHPPLSSNSNRKQICVTIPQKKDEEKKSEDNLNKGPTPP
jgi:hypothetical protein